MKSCHLQQHEWTYAKWNKSYGERLILYDFTNKRQQIIKTKQKTPRDTENSAYQVSAYQRAMVFGGEWNGWVYHMWWMAARTYG